MSSHLFSRPLVASLAGALLCFVAAPHLAAEGRTQVRLTVDEDPVVPRLAESLGYFASEGLEVTRVDLLTVAPDDYLMQKPLIDGKIDVSYHWFNHTVFGVHHNLPIKAVMMFNDAPGMTVLVANRVKDQIKTAADFKGRNVAEGAGYGTKSVLTHYLTRKAGLGPHDFTPVMLAHDGRQQAVLQGLREDKVDVMTFEEPITSALLATGVVTPLYDLNSGPTTAKVLGAVWPAQSLLVAPSYISAHPDTVQHVVNAFVKTMRFVNSHSPDEIIAALPPSFWEGKDRAAETEFVKRTLGSYARGNYAISAKSARLVLDTMEHFEFDDSQEGQWRRGAEHPSVDPDQLYDNRFVKKAMKAIP
jgi:NitT/TauT family transport system substrate-binding protein